MSQYLLSFARQHLEGRTDAYLALLWYMYKARFSRTRRYSDQIKLYITETADLLLHTDYQRVAGRVKKVLDNRPELDWVAPSGLHPIASMQIRNFRGFGSFGSEDKGTFLRFSRMKNIFYAPNGGGKSSLCEALELGTTGNIKEAGRRKTKLNNYIARSSAKPFLELIGTDKQPATRSLTWSSCFIDRNRLQEFSLLGSKDTGSAENDVLATLFGLEEFQQVLSRFVKPDTFNLKSLLRTDKADAIAALKAERRGLLAQRRQHQAAFEVTQAKICAHLNLRPSDDYARDERLGRIAKLVDLKIRAAERLRVANAPTPMPMSRIDRVYSTSLRLLKRKAHIDADLARKAAAVNYQAVYEALDAISNLQVFDSCPACMTPMNSVTQNPFERARAELAALGALERLQASAKQAKAKIVAFASKVASGVEVINSNARLGMKCPVPMEALSGAVAAFQEATDRSLVGAEVLEALINFYEHNTQEINSYSRACERRGLEVSQATGKATHIDNEVAELRKLGDAFRDLYGARRTAKKAFQEANAKMAQLSSDQERLKQDASDNTRFNAFISELQQAYGDLHHDLLAFKLSLEKSRIAGIESKAAEYYQAINNHDDKHEQVESLRFDKSSDAYRIIIANSDGVTLDAFSTLSEGHLRVLGLSLLLAMAQKNNFPLIVFDDVVNAIDSDHRSNIIDLFFTDDYLRSIQMVVTTHDRLFWERFCIIAERHPQCDQYSSNVLSYSNRGIVVIDHAGGFQEKVYRALSVYDIRQALVYCRIWFESMVLEYCIENRLSIFAEFGRSQLKKNMYLQISLEKTFSLIEPIIGYDKTHYNSIKSDLVNWSGQNQEHHAFDDGSLNFVHSKTSNEVIRIYDAIRLFECQLFAENKKASAEKLLPELNALLEKAKAKIQKLDRAPVQVQQAHHAHLMALEKRAADVRQELRYSETCLAAIAQKAKPHSDSDDA